MDNKDSLKEKFLNKKIKYLESKMTNLLNTFNHRRKPNIFFVIVDEFRYPLEYESADLKQWKNENFQFAEQLRAIGTEFHNHRTNTCACVPARTTLQTGVYPAIHGSFSTDAVAKPATDPLMTWLPPFTVPTIGNYLKEHGYKTYLRGKWHMTHVNIEGESGRTYPTYDFYGTRMAEAEQFYAEKNVLKDFGYNGWIGPDAHGRLGTDTASSAPPPKKSRDEAFVDQTIDILDELDRQNTPWYVCTNLVDPHDIALRGDYTLLRTLNFQFLADPTLPATLWTADFTASMMDDLSLKPPTQANYRTIYPLAFQTISSIEDHWRYYYTLQKRVDQKLMQIFEKLQTMRSYNNTVIVYTSDHGDLLGSHGGLFQKWYQAYEEALHVPLIIASPLFQGEAVSDVYDLTSHIDILPTLVDIARGNIESLRKSLSDKFSLAVPVPGISIYPRVFDEEIADRPFFFYTEDDPTKGSTQIGLTGVPYTSIAEPASCEALVAKYGGQMWKSTYYYNRTAPLRLPRTNSSIRELYNMTVDPYELNNLITSADPGVAAARDYMDQLLVEKSFIYRNMLNQL